MTTPLLVILITVGILLLGEVLLWRLFRRRIDPMIFPPESDASQLRFFHLGRLRLLALVHAAALGTTLVLSLLWLW